jgi:surfactin synthase thioesterase subunit
VAGRWLVRRERRPHAALRLYCFPHSGGSPGEYVRWSDDLPEVEVWGVQTPGHGSRLGESPFRQMRPLVDALLGEASFEAPFAFFGHSLGALVAYEVARTLRARGDEQPERLFLSAYPAPHLPRAGPVTHLLPDSELLAVLEAQAGALPEELRGDPALLRPLLAAFRADCEVFETYRPPDDTPLDLPFLVLGGVEDHEATAGLGEWRRYTTGPFELRLFPGGHFYLREERPAVLRLVRGGLPRREAGSAACPPRATRR